MMRSMFSKKKIFLFIALLAIMLSAFAAEINYNSEPKDFLIFNRRNSKLYNYIILKPSENISCALLNVDTLNVYSRTIVSRNSLLDYQYKLVIGAEERILDKSASLSKTSRGVNGERVSSYNKFSTNILNEKTSVEITNISQNDLVFKIIGSNIITSNKEIDYIRFTPIFYGDEKILVLDEKEYTYYTPKANKIHLTLEGPIVLKIISRMLFNTNFINNSGYRFKVFDNRVLFAEFSEKAYKSKKNWLKNESDITPSTGDVNIIKLPEGIHHITIEDNDNNRELIFRFYINKSSVEIEKQ